MTIANIKLWIGANLVTLGMRFMRRGERDLISSIGASIVAVYPRDTFSLLMLPSTLGWVNGSIIAKGIKLEGMPNKERADVVARNVEAYAQGLAHHLLPSAQINTWAEARGKEAPPSYVG